MRTVVYKQKGSVVLVALCFVAVMAIAVTTYLTLSSRAMNLSARSAQTGLSSQLAETGMELAMSAVNNNSWSGWTTSGAKATLTLSTASTPALPSYGMGITPSVKILVTNRNVSNWRSATTYSAGNLAWYLGQWYQCTSAVGPSAVPPPSATANWASAPGAWNATITYAAGDVVFLNGAAYRCLLANTGTTPPDVTYWVNTNISTWNSGNSYAVNATVFLNGTVYKCIAAHSNQTPPNTTYWAGSPVIYSEGIATLPNNTAALKTQLRADFAPAPLFPNAIGATNTSSTSVNFASAAGIVDSYNSGINPGASSYTSPTQVGTLSNYSAVVAGPSVTVSGATTISGYVAANSTSFGSSTIVKATSATPTPKVTLSRVSNNPYVPNFDVQSITTGTNINGTGYLADGATTIGTVGATTPTVYNITGTYDDGFLRSGLYLTDSGDVLTINGPVVINVSGTLHTQGGRIVISPTGSLEIRFTGQLYVGDNSATGGFDNQTYDPKKLLIVGTNSTTSSGYNYFWQKRDFYGRLYMPNAHIHFWNSGYTRQFYGAILGKNVYFNHTANMHYDLSLRNVAGTGTFIDSPMQVTSWRELTDPTECISL